MASEYDVVGAFQDIELDLIKSMKIEVRQFMTLILRSLKTNA